MSQPKLMLELGKADVPANLTFVTAAELTLARARLHEPESPTMFRNYAGAHGIYQRPGLISCAVELSTRLMQVDKTYPSPDDAFSVFNEAPDAARYYSFSREGRLWSIDTLESGPRDFAVDQEWVFLLDGRPVELRFPFVDLIEAMKLLPLLNGDHDEQAVRSTIKDSEPQRRLFASLMDSGAVSAVEPAPIDPTPTFMFVGHSSLYVRTEQTSIIVDPAIYRTEKGDLDPAAFQLLADTEAVLISHHHWDHLNPSTLVRIRRDKPIFVPRCHEPSFANPPMAHYLRRLGFTNVTEVSPWERRSFGDITVTFAPFYGEPFGLRSRFDGFTYLIEANGQVLYSSVDGRQDEVGSMDPVIVEIAERTSVDFFLFGSSNQTFHRPAIAGTPWRYSNDLMTRPELLRYHPNTADALRWTDILEPSYCVPFAQFIWDGIVAPAVVLPRDEPSELDDQYEDYWRQRDASPTCRSLEDTPDLQEWKRRLDELQRWNCVNLLMLHPMQRIVFE